MAEDKEWYAYPDGKSFECPICGKQIERKDKRWWNKNTKQAICNTCFIDNPKDKKDPNTPPTREENIERMHADKMKLLQLIADRVQIVAEQVSLVANKQQKRNELLEAKK